MSSHLPILHAAILAAAAVALLAAAWHDVRSFRIPNVYCLILLLLFPAMALTAPDSAAMRWTSHLIVFAVVLALGMALNYFKLLGGGDAKLIAAISLWAGPSYILQLLFYVTLAGGLLATLLGLLTFARSQRAKAGEDAQAMKKLAQTPIPYGIAICVGGMVMIAHLAQTHLFLPTPVTG